MVAENFTTAKELYERVLPALSSKKREFALNKIKFVNELDIWNYLSINRWSKERSLTLFDIVNDILSVTEEEIIEYVNQKKGE